MSTFRSWSILVCVCLLHSLAMAGPLSPGSPQEVLVSFDGLCVGTDGELSVIEKMAAASNAKQAPEEFTNQDPSMARNGGRAFIFKRGAFQFVIAATPLGTCSLLGRVLDQQKLRKLVESNYPLANPHVDNSGPQTVWLYRVIQPSVHEGGYIMVNIPKPGFEANSYVSLGFIPRKAAVNVRKNSQK
jgi:hypothetical protein